MEGVKKEKVNKMTMIPKQKTTIGGLTVVVQQLIQILSNVPIGGWIASLLAEGVTYGAILSSYWPIAAGLLLIFFDEDKWGKHGNI